MDTSFKDYFSSKSNDYANYRPRYTEWNFYQLYGYLTTWSAFKAFEAAGGTAEIQSFKEKLISLWGDLESTQKMHWPLSVRAAYINQ